MSGPRLLASAIVLTALVAALPAAPAAAQVRPRFVIPPGREGIASRMMGLGLATAGCRTGDVAIEEARIVATYACGAQRVEVALVHRDVAGVARTTERFGIVAEGAPAPLLDALAARVRREEGGFEWIAPTPSWDGAPPDIAPVDPQPTMELPPPIASRYAEGLDLYRAGRHAEALALFTELASEHPRGGVLGMLVATLASTRPSAERVEALARARTARPTTRSRSSWRGSRPTTTHTRAVAIGGRRSATTRRRSATSCARARRTTSRRASSSTSR
jgi:hypothetical protein